jgi:putative Mg2+ transporter-C (MgtC) family protein
MNMELLEIAFKLILAVSLGGLIGLERESGRKAAGLRTNTLVCLGAAMMMTLAVLIVRNQAGLPDSLIRLAAGVIAGVGFLGAGAIIQARGSSTGLTTAATIWVVAGLGLVIGAGYPIPAVLFTGAVMVVLVVFRRIEDADLKTSPYRFQIKVKDNPEFLSGLRKLAFHHGTKLDDLVVKKTKIRQILTFSIRAGEEKEQALTEEIQNLEGIEEFKIE